MSRGMKGAIERAFCALGALVLSLGLALPAQAGAGPASPSVGATAPGPAPAAQPQGGGFVEVETQGAAPPPAEVKVSSQTIRPGLVNWADDAEPCPPTDDRYDDYVVICAEATAQDVEQVGPVLTIHNTTSNVIKPNRSILVMVRTLKGMAQQVTVSLREEANTAKGTSAPLVQAHDAGHMQAARNVAGVTSRGGGAAGGVMNFATRVDRREFVPRTGGHSVTVSVSVNSGQGGGMAGQTELFVEETYVGAFRVGLAGVFLGGQDAQYGVGLVGNSMQQEVVAQPGDPLNVDIVIGYSAFFDANGRSARGCETAPFCFAPFVGLGLLSPTADGVTWLKSIHLGIEWELVPNFAIAVTGAVRRVDRLQEGYVVGGPVPNGLDGVPTREAWNVGLGVVLNLSPDFFKVAGGLL